ncbi:ParB/RepB/Spo0J family partition protein [Streptomyces lavendulocolor]|uniref:ParB/RepB/Spo0J family partition protein n=1 Tax=Streptomyces lavendulocolor TaxID=67316 RepID=UPI003C2AE303
MSKAETLGASSAFASAAGAISARRMVTQQAFGQSAAGPITEVPVTDISLNPANPRSELGDLTDLAGSLRDHGQKTAISIMSRDAYLAAHPEHADKLEGGTRYVAVDGNSRLAAAREAGLRTLKVMVDDGLGKDADDLLESSLVANIHRRDLDHLDEARALERLLTIHGTQEALAARLHRSQGWVSQRLALLKLTPELQERLERGQEPADLLRRVGNKKPEEQAAHLERLKQERKAKQQPNKSPASIVTGQPHAAADDAAAPSEDSGYYDVMKQGRSQETAAGPGDELPASPGRSTAPAVAPPPSSVPPGGAVSPSPVPDQRAEGSVAPGGPVQVQDPVPVKPVIKMPWEDGLRVAEIAIEMMDSLVEMTRLYERIGQELGRRDSKAVG